MNPTQKSPERAMALQKYLLLHSQHDALQKHLDAITTSLPTRPTFSPSPSASPHRYSSRHSSLSSSSTSSEDSYLARQSYRSSSIQLPSAPPLHRPSVTKRRSSLPTVIDESILGEIEEEQGKLKDVNQHIKSTLTDLLNCESVRGDKRYRMWVQTRLMDTEKELKGGRARSCERSGGRRGILRGCIRERDKGNYCDSDGRDGRMDFDSDGRLGLGSDLVE